jgi:exodeoxyribonuclease VII small subunit
MSKPRGRLQQSDASGAGIGGPGEETLDQAIAKLETIVRQLESNDVDLDKALVLFEEGVIRLRAARARLEQAELKVQQVLEQASGVLGTDDLDL